MNMETAQLEAMGITTRLGICRAGVRAVISRTNDTSMSVQMGILACECCAESAGCTTETEEAAAWAARLAQGL